MINGKLLKNSLFIWIRIILDKGKGDFCVWEIFLVDLLNDLLLLIIYIFIYDLGLLPRNKRQLLLKENTYLNF